MRSRWKRMSMVCAATLPLLSCAPKEYSLGPDRVKWLEGDRDQAANAKEMKEPNILPKTHFAAGQLFEQQGQIQKAIVQYRKAVSAAPDYVPAYNRLGVLLGRLGRHAEAEESLRQAVGMRPDWAFLRNNMGFEYMLQERWSDAEAELRNALRLQPDFARAHNNLGVVLAKLGRFDEALVEFKEAMPESDAVYNLGLMYRGQNHYPEAADAFERALSLEPKFEAAKYQLAQVAPGSQRLARSAPATISEPALATVSVNPVIEEQGSREQSIATAGHVLVVEPIPTIEPASVTELEVPATLADSDISAGDTMSTSVIPSDIDPSVLIVDAEPCDEAAETLAQHSRAVDESADDESLTTHYSPLTIESPEGSADQPALDVGLANDEIPLGFNDLAEQDDPCDAEVAAEYEFEAMQSFAERGDEESTSITLDEVPASPEQEPLLARIWEAWVLMLSAIPELAEDAAVLPVAAESAVEAEIEEAEIALAIPTEESLALLCDFSSDGAAHFQPTDAWREMLGVLDAGLAFAALPRTDLAFEFKTSEDIAMILGD